MITEEAFYGGAEYRAFGTSVVLPPGAKRVQRLVPSTSGLLVTLPAAAFRTQLGSPHFVLINKGAHSLSIRDGDVTATVLAVLPANGVAKIARVRSSGTYSWKVRLYTLNTGRTAGRAARGTVGNIVPAPRTYTPDCTLDICEVTEGLASPLSIPMFMNSCEARNSYREPIRGADAAQPAKMFLKILSGMARRDMLHPWNIFHPISQECMDALVKSEGWHHLEYVGAIASSTSRHWHHMRLQDGGTPAWWMPVYPSILDVTRHYYQVLIDYTLDDATFTITLRASIEWSDFDNEHGAYGAIINFYAFTNEAYSSFADGNSYTPAGAVAPIVFSKADPCVAGITTGVDDPSAKFCHPQLLFAACVPTTFEAPCGGQKVPYGQDRFAYCYSEDNGSPWGTGSGINSSFRNVVFGDLDPGAGDGAAAMTLGGDVPTSSVFEWTVLENGGATGQTILAPLHTGYSETAGNIDLLGGTDLVFRWCDPGQEDEAVDPCDGHPDGKMGGEGGTHKCWLSADDPSYVCIPTDGAATIFANRQCMTSTVVFGDDLGGGDCDIVNTTCAASVKLFSYTGEVSEYFYNFHGAASSRTLTFTGLYTDPSYTPSNFFIDTDGTADLSDEIGTVGYATTVATFSAVSAGNNVSGFLAFIPAIDLLDAIVTATAKTGTSTIPHGLGGRASVSGGDYTGYAAFVVPSPTPGAAAVRLYEVTADTLTLLNETVGLTITGDVALSFTTAGARITFAWSSPTAAFSAGSIYADNCSYQASGFYGAICGGAVTGAVFDHLHVTDTSIVQVSVVSIISADPTANTTIDGALTTAADLEWCPDSFTTGCSGTGGECNCVSLTRTIYASTTDGATSDSNVTAADGAAPAVDCSGCPGGICPDCPPEFVMCGLRLPLGCTTVRAASTWEFVRGFDLWYVPTCVVP